MGTIIRRISGWPFTFGGEDHCGWLPPEASKPMPTPRDQEVLDVQIVKQADGGYILEWAARPSPTCFELHPPKIGDLWCETVEDAEASAYQNFGIRREDWLTVAAAREQNSA